MHKMEPVEEIIKHARQCFLPKLSRNVEEIDNHPEYYNRKNSMDLHFPPLLDLIARADLRSKSEFTTSIMPNIILLYLERSSNSPWNDEECLMYARKLNKAFQSAYQIPIDTIFHNNDFCDIQEVFDCVLKEVNKIATSQEFKKYPGMIKAYYLLVKNLKNYKVSCNPVTLFPICLLLIEDYVVPNKLRGLRCCSAMLACLEEKHFQDGNYYEVIFSSLIKVMTDKKLEVTKLVHECLLEFVRVVPSSAKESKTDEIFSTILEQIHMESNLHRKTVCFGFMKQIIMLHKVNCVKKKLLKSVLCENIDVCCNDAVADILLVDVLQTLRVWVTHCWCVWRLSTDHAILSALIKLLYVSRKEKIATEIQEILVTLILLCSKEERQKILLNLQKSEITAPEFQEKLEQIIRDISE